MSAPKPLRNRYFRGPKSDKRRAFGAFAAIQARFGLVARSSRYKRSGLQILSSHPITFSPFPRTSRCLHDHHDEKHPTFVPASQPTYAPAIDLVAPGHGLAEA